MILPDIWMNAFIWSPLTAHASFSRMKCRYWSFYVILNHGYFLQGVEGSLFAAFSGSLELGGRERVQIDTRMTFSQRLPRCLEQLLYFGLHFRLNLGFLANIGFKINLIFILTLVNFLLSPTFLAFLSIYFWNILIIFFHFLTDSFLFEWIFLPEILKWSRSSLNMYLFNFLMRQRLPNAFYYVLLRIYLLSTWGTHIVVGQLWRRNCEITLVYFPRA